MLFVLSVAMCSSLDVQGNTVTRFSLPQILFYFQGSAEAELQTKVGKTTVKLSSSGECVFECL